MIFHEKMQKILFVFISWPVPRGEPLPPRGYISNSVLRATLATKKHKQKANLHASAWTLKWLG